MVKEVSINNFKSVRDLHLPLSRFNVLIGSNGSGKSNILEAIAFGAAASANKLDNEFLGSRGIRASEVKLMKSAFAGDSHAKPIQLGFTINEDKWVFSVREEEDPIPRWTSTSNFSSVVRTLDPKPLLDAQVLLIQVISRLIRISGRKEMPANELLFQILGDDKHEVSPLAKDRFQQLINRASRLFALDDFIIYSPEIGSLRKLDEESQIKPLGIKGEGLFTLLQIFNESYGAEAIEEIKNHLEVIEWFDDFKAVNDEVTGRKNLVIKDRYIPDQTLNQNNVNEGFLFLLFYISLIVSKETPSFFAIDNVEASFHPTLCRELIKNLVELSKKHDKQIILTTHNPFVLDGLDLSDTEQSLFVVRRNAEGETITDKIDKQPSSIKLSEAWMRGYIGGQPETIE